MPRKCNNKSKERKIILSDEQKQRRMQEHIQRLALYKGRSEKDVDAQSTNEIYQIGTLSSNSNSFHHVKIQQYRREIMEQVVNKPSFAKKMKCLTEKFGAGCMVLFFSNPCDFIQGKKANLKEIIFENCGIEHPGDKRCFIHNWLVWYPIAKLQKIWSIAKPNYFRLMSKYCDGVAIVQFIIYRDFPVNLNFVQLEHILCSAKYRQQQAKFSDEFFQNLHKNENYNTEMCLKELQQHCEWMYQRLKYLKNNDRILKVQEKDIPGFSRVCNMLSKSDVETLTNQNEKGYITIKHSKLELINFLSSILADSELDNLLYCGMNSERMQQWVISFVDILFPTNLPQTLRNNVENLNLVIPSMQTPRADHESIPQTAKNDNEEKNADESAGKTIKKTLNVTEEDWENTKLLLMQYRTELDKIISKETQFDSNDDNGAISKVIDVIELIVTFAHNKEMIQDITNHAIRVLGYYQKLKDSGDLQYLPDMESPIFEIKMSPMLVLLQNEQTKFLSLIDKYNKYLTKQVHHDTDEFKKMSQNKLLVFKDLFRQFSGKECVNCHKSSKEVTLYQCDRCNAVRYCSIECQKNHWNWMHKYCCRK